MRIGPRRVRKYQVNIFAEPPTARRVTADSFSRRVVEWKHSGKCHFPPKKLKQYSFVYFALVHVRSRVLSKLKYEMIAEVLR